MKKTLIVIAAFFAGISSFGQSVNLDRLHLDYACRNLPILSLPTDERTFTVYAEYGKEALQQNESPSYFEKSINIEGLEYVEANASITIEFDYSGIIVKERGIDEVRHEEKDRDGKVVKRWLTFVPFVNYVYDSKYSVVGPNGNILYSSFISNFNMTSFKTYRGREFAKNKDAIDYLRLNGDVITNDLNTVALNEATAAINNDINAKFGYKVLTGKVTVWYLGTKKHPEYLMHQGNFNAIKNVLDKITPDGGIEEARKEVAPYLEYLESIKAKYASDNKKDKKMRYASFYNLAVIYTLLDMPDEAIKQAEGLIANDYDTSDGKRLIKDAEKLKKSFADNRTNTSHFPISWLSGK